MNDFKSSKLSEEKDLKTKIKKYDKKLKLIQEKEAKLEKERMIQEAIQKAQERQDPHDLLFLMEAKYGKYMTITINVHGSLMFNVTCQEKRLPPDQEERFAQLRTNVTIREPYNDLILLKKQLQETQQQQEIEIVKIGTRNLLKALNFI